jgi:chloramphenicol-sensitive protein RarD
MTTATRSGVPMGILAYLIWGLLPLYLHLLARLGPVSILAQRVLWSLLLVGAAVLVSRRGAKLRTAAGNARLIGTLAISATLIAINWLTYIYAVNSHQTLQASLGYFINPLINVLLGLIVLRERIGRTEAAAILLALTGVIILAVGQHAVPTLALAVAFSFSLYGLVRKLAPVEALEGLMIETILLAPLAFAWVGWHDGFGLAGLSLPLVAASGVVTALPLLLFAAAAKRMRFAELGLLQYMTPTMQMLCAVLAFGERLTPVHLAAFAFIWGGLAVYASATWRRARSVMVPD